MASLEDHPGFLGLTSHGVIAIHADWPMYPEEHGADLALVWLTAFPPSTQFKPIDDIDQCILFLADVKCSNRADPFDERNLHVAIWHEDLAELSQRGFVSGVNVVTERQWEVNKRENLPSDELFYKTDDGEYKQLTLSPLDDFDDEHPSWPEFDPDGIKVTAIGLRQAHTILSSLEFEYGILGDRIERLYELSYFDTAVREACIQIEHNIRLGLGSDRWGDVLVDQLFTVLKESGSYRQSYLRVLRIHTKTVFKFIRNEFMHAFVAMDEAQCRALLFRLARAKAELDKVMPDA